MHFLPAAKSWRTALLATLVLFVVSRAITLTAFPIFNDEAIYLQYAQAMHDDWEKNKFISMNGFYQDWKPPLQYWITALVVGLGDDPLIVGRLVAFVISVIGFFGLYAFTKELFGKAEALVATALYALCPTVLFHNNQFTAETFLFSVAPVLYWTIMKALGPGATRWLWLAAAIASGTALLLLKQSGLLLIGLAIFLPFAQLHHAGETNAPTRVRWTEFTINCCLVAAVIYFSHLLSRFALPSEFNATEARFNAQWVMSPHELLRLPTSTWGINLRFVGDYIGAYYSWSVAVFVFAFAWFALREKRPPELALGAMCFMATAALCFGLRAFHEYLLNTAVIAVLLPLLARTGVRIWNLGRVGAGGILRGGGLALAGLTFVFWIYQIGLMAMNPGKYIERSTPWAVANYLKNWSTGFGVKETVAMLAEVKEPGVIFADSQWGNPRTALELYARRRFPDLKIIPITREFLNNEETRRRRDYARTLGPVRLAIFSAENSGPRAQWQENIAGEMCEARSEVKAYSAQTPIVFCRF